jgi:hypothetical protein
MRKRASFERGRPACCATSWAFDLAVTVDVLGITVDVLAATVDALAVVLVPAIALAVAGLSLAALDALDVVLIITHVVLTHPLVVRRPWLSSGPSPLASFPHMAFNAYPWPIWRVLSAVRCPAPRRLSNAAIGQPLHHLQDLVPGPLDLVPGLLDPVNVPSETGRRGPAPHRGVAVRA